MKTTYRLPGLFWDHRPESHNRSEPVPYDVRYSAFGSPRCLFDCDGNRRFINLTTLFAMSGKDDVKSLHHQLRDCIEVAVMLDYMPSSPGRVQRDFYWQRVRQALCLVEECAPIQMPVRDRPSI